MEARGFSWQPIEYAVQYENVDMRMKIQAGTKALHERDCAALAARNAAGSSRIAGTSVA